MNERGGIHKYIYTCTKFHYYTSSAQWWVRAHARTSRAYFYRRARKLEPLGYSAKIRKFCYIDKGLSPNSWFFARAWLLKGSTHHSAYYCLCIYFVELESGELNGKCLQRNAQWIKWETSIDWMKLNWIRTQLRRQAALLRSTQC